MKRVFAAAGLAWLLAGGAVSAQDSGTSGEKTGIKVLDLGPPGSSGSNGATGSGGTVKLPRSPGSARPGAALPKNRAIGTLDASRGGLGRTLWAGSSFNRVEDMMARLPADSASPAMRALMRRLLLTLADPPADTPAARSLLPVRAERLYAMADAGAVDALLGRAEDLLDQLMARMRIDAWLLANEIDPACVLVSDTLAAHPSHYLQKVSVFCQVHRGMGDQSRITLELVREEATLQAGPEKAAFKEFEELFLRIGQKKTRPVRRLKSVTPLHLAMLNAANAGVPPRAAKGLDFPKRLAVARNPHTRVKTRLAGAEDGVAAGALEPVHLERTYMAMRLPNISAERVRSTPARTFGPRQRAMFFQADR